MNLNVLLFTLNIYTPLGSVDVSTGVPSQCSVPIIFLPSALKMEAEAVSLIPLADSMLPS